MTSVITARVKLFATLRRHRPGLGLGEAFPVEVEAGATVGELLGAVGVPEDEVKLIFVNGLARGPEYMLADGDELGIFPPVGGG